MSVPQPVIDSVKRKIAYHQAELREAEAELRRLRQEQTGLVPGETILVHKGTGEERLLTKVEFWSSGTAWCEGKKRKKNGEWYENAQHIGTVEAPGAKATHSPWTVKP